MEYQDSVVGSEQKAGRPAIIVSNNKINKHSDVVEVVYLTTRKKCFAATHVPIQSTGVLSTALCEQIHSVARQRLGSYFGKCTQGELQKIDDALLISLGMNKDFRRNNPHFTRPKLSDTADNLR